MADNIKKENLLFRLNMPEKVTEFFKSYGQGFNEFNALRVEIKFDNTMQNFNFVSRPLEYEHPKHRYYGKLSELKYILSFLVNNKGLDKERVDVRNHYGLKLARIDHYLIKIPEKNNYKQDYIEPVKSDKTADKEATEAKIKPQNKEKKPKEYKKPEIKKPSGPAYLRKYPLKQKEDFETVKQEERYLLRKIHVFADEAKDGKDFLAKIIDMLMIYKRTSNQNFITSGMGFIKGVREGKSVAKIENLNKIFVELGFSTKVNNNIVNLIKKTDLYNVQDIAILKALILTNKINSRNKDPEYVRDKQHKIGINYIANNLKAAPIVPAIGKFVRLVEGRSIESSKEFIPQNLSQLEKNGKNPEIETLLKVFKDFGIRPNVVDHAFYRLESNQIYREDDVIITRFLYENRHIKTKEAKQIKGIEHLCSIYSKESNLLGVLIKFLRISEGMHRNSFEKHKGGKIDRVTINALEEGGKDVRLQTLSDIICGMPLSGNVVKKMFDIFNEKELVQKADIENLKTIKFSKPETAVILGFISHQKRSKTEGQAVGE